MGLFKLSYTNHTNQDINKGILLTAKEEKIDYEESFENWLENSPDVLFDDWSSTVLWIGRQETADVGDTKKFPDLIGIDSRGNIIIVELKKDKSPREVVAQILEYASWASNLNNDSLNDIFSKYCEKRNKEKKSLLEEFKSVFYPDDDEAPTPEFNREQKMFVIAEELSSSILQVANYLRRYKINIFCIEYTVHKTGQGEIFVSTERKVGDEEFSENKPNNEVWNESIKIRDAVYEAVKSITSKDLSKIFSPVEVYKELEKKYPTVNRSTINCTLVADCVNHKSRKHYPGGQKDYYFWEGKGKYRLYNPSTDGKWNKFGEKIS